MGREQIDETRGQRGMQEGQEDGETAMGRDERAEKHAGTLGRWGESKVGRRGGRKALRKVKGLGERQAGRI